MQAFPDWLRDRLTERGWSNADLERASGVSNSIIWRWRAVRPRRPTPANLKRIAGPLGANYEDLMKMCGYLPGEPDHSQDNDLQARLEGIRAVLIGIPRVFWPAVTAAVTSLAEALPSDTPVSESNRVPVRDGTPDANGNTSQEPPVLPERNRERRQHLSWSVTGLTRVTVPVSV